MKTNMFGRGCVLALVWVAAPVWFSCGKCSGRTTVVAAPITPEQVVVQVRAAVMTAGASQSLFGWRCGAAADGTTVSAKYLPGSCRG